MEDNKCLYCTKTECDNCMTKEYYLFMDDDMEYVSNPELSNKEVAKILDIDAKKVYEKRKRMGMRNYRKLSTNQKAWSKEETSYLLNYGIDKTVERYGRTRTACYLMKRRLSV